MIIKIVGPIAEFTVVLFLFIVCVVLIWCFLMDVSIRLPQILNEYQGWRSIPIYVPPVHGQDRDFVSISDEQVQEEYLKIFQLAAHDGQRGDYREKWLKPFRKAIWNVYNNDQLSNKSKFAKLLNYEQQLIEFINRFGVDQMILNPYIHDVKNRHYSGWRDLHQKQ